jgi:hypothetical protein
MQGCPKYTCEVPYRTMPNWIALNWAVWSQTYVCIRNRHVKCTTRFHVWRAVCWLNEQVLAPCDGLGSKTICYFPCFCVLDKIAGVSNSKIPSSCWFYLVKATNRVFSVSTKLNHIVIAFSSVHNLTLLVLHFFSWILLWFL